MAPVSLGCQTKSPAPLKIYFYHQKEDRKQIFGVLPPPSRAVHFPPCFTFSFLFSIKKNWTALNVRIGSAAFLAVPLVTFALCAGTRPLLHRRRKGTSVANDLLTGINQERPAAVALAIKTQGNFGFKAGRV